MRAARGSGVAGLGGIRARWTWERHRWHRGYPQGGVVAVADVDAIPVIRPLLGWRRAELAEVIAATGTPFVTDPSNADDRFDRVRMRALLAEHPISTRAQIAARRRRLRRSRRRDRRDDDLLRRERMREDDVYARRYDVDRPAARTSPTPGARRDRLCPRRQRHHRRPLVRRDQCRGAARCARGGGKATLAGVLASADGDLWHFAEAPPRRVDLIAAVPLPLTSARLYCAGDERSRPTMNDNDKQPDEQRRRQSLDEEPDDLGRHPAGAGAVRAAVRQPRWRDREHEVAYSTFLDKVDQGTVKDVVDQPRGDRLARRARARNSARARCRCRIRRSSRRCARRA